MSRLEDELKSALGRKEPGGDFVAQVMRRAGQPAPRRWSDELRMLFRPPRLQWVVATLVVGLIVPFGALEYRREREVRLQGQMAKEQLILAVRIAGSELRNVQQKIHRMETQ